MAELPAEARDYADSVARRGRAVAENLIAATQRPTQDAMGKGTAIRSQMDIRICLRVREPRDADLILGQGSVNSGWHAHKLAKPGEFLISSLSTPCRNGTGPTCSQMRDGTTTRPTAPRTAPAAASQPDTPRRPQPPQTAPDGPTKATATRPETALWTPWWTPPDGSPSPNWKPPAAWPRWIYYRLQAHATAAGPSRSGAATGAPSGRETAGPRPAHPPATAWAATASPPGDGR